MCSFDIGISSVKESGGYIPKGGFRARMRFCKSERNGKLVGFVHRDFKSGKVVGVPKDADCPKQVCTVDIRLAEKLVPDVLYDVMAVPMRQKSGFVVVRAERVSFQPRLVTHCISKQVYIVSAKFGNQTVAYSPDETLDRAFHDIDEACSVILKHGEIKNVDGFVSDFRDAAIRMDEQYEHDGF